MKNFTLTALALLFALPLFAQRQRVADQDRMTRTHSYEPMKEQLFSANENLPTSKQIVPLDMGAGLAPLGTSAVTPITLGRASNAFTILRVLQQQMVASDSLDLVAFIHRQDVTVWGGGSGESGKLRYDLSTDGGQTWSVDAGVLNPTYSRPARYPNIALFNNSGGSNPFNAKIVYGAATLNPSPDWDGHVYGLAEVSSNTSGITTTENYNFLGAGTLIPGNMIQGAPGEFWQTDVSYTNGAASDTLNVYRGIYNSSSQDIDWANFAKLYPPYATNHPNAPVVIGPQISFSPDGQTGWLGLLSDLGGVNGDSAVAPVLSYSTDAGATWSNFTEVDLNQISWIADSLRTLWVDSTGNPAGTGRATTSFDFDLTVDANGNPHFFTVIGNVTSTTTPDPTYSIFSSLTMFTADITTTDLGTTWTARYIGPVLSLRGEDFGDPQDPISMDNYPQVSRSEDGRYIFYSWTDTDSITVGFGNSDNIAPNIRIAGMRISDGFQTCFKRITDGDLVYGGQILYPTMAQSVIERNGVWHLPITSLNMITNNQLQPCTFWYWGEEAFFSEAEFQDPANLDLSYDGACGPVSINKPTIAEGISLSKPFPNPTNNTATIRFELDRSSDVTVDLVNVFGQQVARLAEGNYSAGVHDLNANTRDLADGVYYVSLRSGTSTYTQKLIVVK